MAFGTFERMVAVRYLRARRQEGFISVIAGFSLLGIALGVATLIIVMSVMNGFRAELLGRILGVNGHVTVSAAGATALTDYGPTVERLAKVAGVVMVTPQVDGQVMASANNVVSGALVRGVAVEALARHAVLARALREGTIEALADEGHIMIGVRMAQRMGLRVGAGLTLISPRGAATPFGTMPRIKTYVVGAVFEVGMYEYDNSFVYMALPAAQAFFGLEENQANAIELMLDDADRAPGLRGEIAQVAGPGHRVLDWQRVNSSFFTAVQVERNVMFLILTLIIVVAAFNIISSMIMLVKDKGRDIAILRTMGATRGMILRIFFLAGASIGVVGTIAGFALGLAFCANIETIRQGIEKLTETNLFNAEIYFLARLPAKVDASEVVTVVVMALVLTFLATIYPAWRAARLDPVEALRYE